MLLHCLQLESRTCRQTDGLHRSEIYLSLTAADQQASPFGDTSSLHLTDNKGGKKVITSEVGRREDDSFYIYILCISNFLLYAPWLQEQNKLYNYKWEGGRRKKDGGGREARRYSYIRESSHYLTNWLTVTHILNTKWKSIIFWSYCTSEFCLYSTWNVRSASVTSDKEGKLDGRR